MPGVLNPHSLERQLVLQGLQVKRGEKWAGLAWRGSCSEARHLFKPSDADLSELKMGLARTGQVGRPSYTGDSWDTIDDKGPSPRRSHRTGKEQKRCCQHLEKKWWHVEQRQDGRPLGQLGGASPELPMRLRRLCRSLSTVGGLTNHALVKGEVLKAKGADGLCHI